MIKTGIARYRAYTAKEQLSVSAVLLTVVVFLILLTASVFGKNIILEIDGKQNSYFVFNDTVADFIKAYNVDFCEYDEISVLPESELTDNELIEIKKAVPVKFTLNGETNEIYTAKTTVQEFLLENGVVLEEYDLLSVKENSKIAKGMKIGLEKAEVFYETVEEAIPFKTVLVPNYSKKRGDDTVTSEGKDGKKETCYMVVKRNNEVVSKEAISESVVQEPINQVKEYGAVVANLTSRNAGASFRYKNVITMTATAYDLSYESCGKTPSSPGYGITASGMRARRGVVAVDTSVIPLGTRLYIETTDGSFSYGYAVAGDRGGAIRGNRIDLFMDTRSECLQFGRRNVNVYILE